ARFPFPPPPGPVDSFQYASCQTMQQGDTPQPAVELVGQVIAKRPVTGAGRFEMTMGTGQSLPQGELLGEGQRRRVAELTQNPLAIAIGVRNLGEPPAANARAEQVRRQDIYALATMHK